MLAKRKKNRGKRGASRGIDPGVADRDSLGKDHRNVVPKQRDKPSWGRG